MAINFFLWRRGPTPAACHRSPSARGGDSWRLSAQSISRTWPRVCRRSPSARGG